MGAGAGGVDLMTHWRSRILFAGGSASSGSGVGWGVDGGDDGTCTDDTFLISTAFLSASSVSSHQLSLNRGSRAAAVMKRSLSSYRVMRASTDDLRACVKTLLYVLEISPTSSLRARAQIAARLADTVFCFWTSKVASSKGPRILHSSTSSWRSSGDRPAPLAWPHPQPGKSGCWSTVSSIL